MTTAASDITYHSRALNLRLDEIVHISDYALGDGSDDTQAFHDALALKKPVYIAPGHSYHIGELQLSDDAVLFSHLPATYYNAADMAGLGNRVAQLKALDGASTVLDLNGAKGVRLSGLTINGNAQTAHGISGSALTPHLQDISVFACDIGMGGYWGGAELISCSAGGNKTGLKDLIDAKVYGGFFNANSTGIYMGEGANDNTFIGVKNEWNSQDNYLFYRTSSNSIIGGVIDRAGRYGINLAESELIVSGLKMRRNGYKGGTSGHLHLKDARSVSIHNIITQHGVNDDGSTGLDSPEHAITFAGNSDRVTLIGNDLTGCTGTALINEQTVADYIQRDNQGVDARVSTGTEQAYKGRQFQSRATATVTTGATVSAIALRQAGSGSYSRAPRQLIVTGRNASTGGTLYGELAYVLSREGGPASMKFISQGIQGGNGDHAGTSASDTVQITLNCLTDDGSQLELSATNNRPGTLQLSFELI